MTMWTNSDEVFPRFLKPRLQQLDAICEQPEITNSLFTDQLRPGKSYSALAW